MTSDSNKLSTDVIGGFPYASPNCKGCGRPLLLENAWMADGCPCNHPLGINSMNETRWRLLMKLQQGQTLAIQAAREALEAALPTLNKFSPTAWAKCRAALALLGKKEG